jgi:FlaA1/EpsC-like NDP-sugar epimerase
VAFQRAALPWQDIRVRRVLITGAAGNLGSKLRRHLAARHYELILLDRNSADDPSLMVAELGAFDTAWTDRFAGVDTVVHLAAEPSPLTDWPSLVRSNIDAPINVFAAAAAHRVRRVILRVRYRRCRAMTTRRSDPSRSRWTRTRSISTALPKCLANGSR